jgi:O-antigen/teichoic acid export membrane protein
MALFLASGFSFAVVGLSYLAYSRLLAPADFGLISTGLFLSALATAIFEGSLKNVLIRSSRPPELLDRSALFLAMAILAGAATAMLAVSGILGRMFAQGLSSTDLFFLVGFATIYLLTFPFLVLPAAALERRFEFQRLSLIEAVGTALERGLPLFFLVFNQTNVPLSFIWGALIGRLTRLLALNLLEPPAWGWPTREAWATARMRFMEAMSLMGAYLACLVRDNLHVIIVGSLFGKAWIGYYSWGLQLGMLTSQVFAQISARVSLPLYSQSRDEPSSWTNVTSQIRLLCGLTAPLAIGTLIVLPLLNEVLFLGKWSPTLRLLPMLFVRMATGLATTPVGMLLLARREPLCFWRTNFIWTLVEILGAILAILLVGPIGLAWSYAIVGWIGLWLQVASLEDRPGSRFARVVAAIIGCRSLLISLFGLAVLHFGLALDSMGQICFALSLAITAYLADPFLREKGRDLAGKATLLPSRR